MRHTDKLDRSSELLSRVFTGLENLRSHCQQVKNDILSALLVFLKAKQNKYYHSVLTLAELTKNPTKLELQKHGRLWVVVEHDFIKVIDVVWVNQKVMSIVSLRGIVTTRDIRHILNEILIEKISEVAASTDCSKTKALCEQCQLLAKMDTFLCDEVLEVPQLIDDLSVFLESNKGVLKDISLFSVASFWRSENFVIHTKKLIDALKNDYLNYTDIPTNKNLNL